ncbi:hypothetical protein QUS22_00925 [Wolbachia pipientis]|nr:hypothetical protein [Wolbachia pipientis]
MKDDAFCTAVTENNSVVATVLIQNDQEKQVITTLSVKSNGGVGNKSAPLSTKEINSGKTAMPRVIVKLMASQILNFLYQIHKILNIKKTRITFTLH